ncbi:hypothetical protein NliqN6_3051 [Naganishia liquefaciens]|uniref:non-specific serine/threonine protein kinase n=1 Tax=Naganishia liquefaciens TaxID=104408 RepID=A0A8H3YEM8_9TREE|nr:hypothetical protein NliqN6_3051 [Naganishia liquefaciens]
MSSSSSHVDPEDLYVCQERIGKGSFGEVFKGYDRRTSKPVAIKIIDLEAAEDEIEDIQLEMQILSQMESEYVTKYHGCYLKGERLWIIMEYCSGGSCADLLKSGVFREEYIAIFAKELLKGLEYLHSENKLHRDIKAANILLTANGGVKLADFGVSGQLSATMTKKNTFVGTPYWMSPEVIKQSGYSFSADIWSLGITLLEMAKGEPPYSDLHPMKVLFLIPRNPPPTLDDKFSKPFRDFVALCLQRDPHARPSASELLKHRFVRNAKRPQYLTELIERHENFKSQGAPKAPILPNQGIQTARFGPAKDQFWDFGTIRRDLPIPQPPPAPLDNNPPNTFASLRAAPRPPNQSPAAPHPLQTARVPGAPVSPATQRSNKGPLPKPPSMQSMRQAYSNQASLHAPVVQMSGTGSGSTAGESPKNNRGSEIYNTIRNAAPPAALVASVHAQDRPLHHSESLGPPSLTASPSAIPRQITGDLPQGDMGMDDMILNSVIIPAIESLAMRVPNNEARRALVQLRLAFEEAERLMPGVSVSLVADIVEGVEPFEAETGDR